MNAYEIAVLEMKIDNQHKIIEKLNYRLKHVESSTEEALCNLAIQKETNKLYQLQNTLQGAV